MINLFGCNNCGAKGYGLTGSKIARRTCLYCNNNGCDKCISLVAITHATNYRRVNFNSEEIWDRVGYCSMECLKNALLEGRISLQEYTNRETGKNLLESVQYYEFFLDDINLLSNFQEDVYDIILDKKNIQKFEPILSELSKESCLAQGLLTIFDGYKKLEHEKIIKGLQLCRNDSIYHNNRYIRESIDEISKSYINDLRSYDVPTSRIDKGNISITLAIPKDKKEMKIFACPGCGSPLNKMVIRGQVVKCEHCGGVFEAV